MPMILFDIRALTFDTGGTILDWYTGFKNVLSETGAKHRLDRNWHDLANAIRGQSDGKMLNPCKDARPDHNFDGAHRMALEAVIAEHGLEAFTEAERYAIAREAPHNFDCWTYFPAVLLKLCENFMCASFTILSFRTIMDMARRNGLSRDAVFSCEAIGRYKLLPEAYDTVAYYLQLDPSQSTTSSLMISQLWRQQ